MSLYDNMSKMQLATEVGKMFGTQGFSRLDGLKSTVDSMKAALNANDPMLLKGANGDAPNVKAGGSLTEALGQLGSLIDASIEAKLDGLKPEINAESVEAQIEAIVAKYQGREVTLVTPEGVKIEAGLQHEKFDTLAKLLNIQMNVWVAGPSGTGKTRAALEISKALGRKFYRISCGPQTTASVIFGHTTANGGYAAGPAYTAFREGNCVLLFDEADHLMGGIATMVNGLLDGAPVTFPSGETLAQPKDCAVMVAANTFGVPTPEYPNAQKFSPASRNRFAKIFWDYDTKLETALYAVTPQMKKWVTYCHKVRDAVKKNGIRDLAVTMRSMENALPMFQSGFSSTEVAEMLLFTGIPTDDKSKLLSTCGMPA